MNGELLKDILSTVIFLIPVLGLVWKGAKMAARLEHLESQVKEKTDHLNKNLSLIEEKMEQERLATDSSIATIMATLTEIQKSLVRVETKLDIEEGRK